MCKSTPWLNPHFLDNLKVALTVLVSPVPQLPTPCFVQIRILSTTSPCNPNHRRSRETGQSNPLATPGCCLGLDALELRAAEQFPGNRLRDRRRVVAAGERGTVVRGLEPPAVEPGGLAAPGRFRRHVAPDHGGGRPEGRPADRPGGAGGGTGDRKLGYPDG